MHALYTHLHSCESKQNNNAAVRPVEMHWSTLLSKMTVAV